MKKLLTVSAAMALGATAAAHTQINGAGATFPAPIYTKWFDEYHKLHSDIQINYQPIGSGGGINQITHKTVFFGASDGPMTPDQMNAAPGKILHFPTVLGGVVPVYNIPNFSGELQFTGRVIADIYLGKITKWNDPAIKKLNPNANLPGTDITVVHRSDGSGTTYIWCDYLSKVAPDYKQRVGVATSVNWPVGVGGKGNEGVAGLVSQTPGAFGYVELIYALQNTISFATLKNKSGNWIKASLASTSTAANVPVPADVTKLSLTNTDAPQGYPISTFTWLILYKEQNYDNHQKAKVEAMLKMMWWMTHDGQKYAEPLAYAVLPAPVVKKAEAILKSITFDGKPVLEAGM